MALVQTRLIGAVALCVWLGGCTVPTERSGQPVPRAMEAATDDGVACPADRPAAAARVRIRIDYARDGRPSAVPENCHVAAGTEVVFLAEGAPFEIAFKQQSPGGPRQLPSRAEQGMQKARLRAAGPRATYRYGIRANGIEVDPAIIIH